MNRDYYSYFWLCVLLYDKHNQLYTESKLHCSYRYLRDCLALVLFCSFNPILIYFNSLTFYSITFDSNYISIIFDSNVLYYLSFYITVIVFDLSQRGKKGGFSVLNPEGVYQNPSVTAALQRRVHFHIRVFFLHQVSYNLITLIQLRSL